MNRLWSDNGRSEWNNEEISSSSYWYVLSLVAVYDDCDMSLLKRYEFSEMVVGKASDWKVF